MHADNAGDRYTDLFPLEWIRASAEKLGLLRDQSFVKKEATPEDITIVLRNL